MNQASVFWLAPLDRLTKLSTGDLVRITGRVRQSSYDADGTTRYTVDMIADGFAILAKVNGKPADDEAGE
jgi:single-strand DNA-binding protein